MVLSFPSGVKLNAEQQQLLREAYVRRLGGADNAAVPFVLTDGGDAKKLSFTAEEAQMLDARKFQVIEIARAFGVPPFMIGETEKNSAWGTGIEQMSQGFIRYTLGPHITAIEQELNRKLFGIDRFFVDFDEEALSRGDMKSLGDWFRQAVGGNNGPGFMTVNEVRSRLKLPPVDGGTDIYVPAGGSNAQGTEPAASPAGSEPGQAATV
jgi:HK97 family phage portal protein